MFGLPDKVLLSHMPTQWQLSLRKAVLLVASLCMRKGPPFSNAWCVIRAPESVVLHATEQVQLKLLA